MISLSSPPRRTVRTRHRVHGSVLLQEWPVICYNEPHRFDLRSPAILATEPAATASLAAFDTIFRASGQARARGRGPDRRRFDEHIHLLADIHREVPRVKLVEHL